MNIVSTTFFLKWSDTKKELSRIAEEAADSARFNIFALCHGLFEYKIHRYRNRIMSLAHRSNALSEDFIVHQHFGMKSKLFWRSTPKCSECDDAGPAIAPGKTSKVFSINSPCLNQLMWIPPHRVFLTHADDKMWRVYSDTLNGCQVMSAPQWCPPVVLCMIYLEVTDQVVIGSTGTMQAWQFIISDQPPSNDAEREDEDNEKKQEEEPKQSRYGSERKLLKALEPYDCNLEEEDWIFHLGKHVYRSFLTGKNVYLVIGISSRRIVAVDYVKKVQVWVMGLDTNLNRERQGYLSWEMVESPIYYDKELSYTKDFNSIVYGIRGHLAITCFAYCEQMKYFITAGVEGRILIMTWNSFSLHHVLRAHRGGIVSLLCHPVYPVLISASVDGTIRLWCLKTFIQIDCLSVMDTIESLSLTKDKTMIAYSTAHEVGLYWISYICKYFAKLDSTLVRLYQILSDHETGTPGKIAALFVDGSVAFLSPVTGQLLTMLYPSLENQVFSHLVYDVYTNYCFILNCDGSIIESDCSIMPCRRIRRYCNHGDIFDQKATSIGVAQIYGLDEPGSIENALFAGLHNGQIGLCLPDNIHMVPVQAHSESVTFIGTYVSEMEPRVHESLWDVRAHKTYSDFSLSAKSVTSGMSVMHHPWCYQTFVSGGLSAIRTWLILLTKDFGERLHLKAVADWSLVLQPLLTITIAVGPIEFYSFLPEKLCAANNKGEISVFNLQIVNEVKLLIKPTRIQRRRLETCAVIRGTDQAYFHPKIEDHCAPVTGLDSCFKLNIFASGSCDGCIKIWDGKNTLLREIVFSPTPVTALCFINERDLLVGLDNILSVVLSTTYLTPSMIHHTNALNTEIFDNPCEVLSAERSKVSEFGMEDEVQIDPLLVSDRVMDPKLGNAFSRVRIDKEKKRRLKQNFEKKTTMTPGDQAGNQSSATNRAASPYGDQLAVKKVRSSSQEQLSSNVKQRVTLLELEDWPNYMYHPITLTDMASVKPYIELKVCGNVEDENRKAMIREFVIGMLEEKTQKLIAAKKEDLQAQWNEWSQMVKSNNNDKPELDENYMMDSQLSSLINERASTQTTFETSEITSSSSIVIPGVTKIDLSQMDMRSRLKLEGPPEEEPLQEEEEVEGKPQRTRPSDAQRKAQMRAQMKPVEYRDILKEIAEAAWFRLKLEQLTPDSVAQAILAPEFNRRVQANEKTCVAIGQIYANYTPSHDDKRAVLSVEVKQACQKFILDQLNDCKVGGKHVGKARQSYFSNAVSALEEGLPADKSIQILLCRFMNDDPDKVIQIAANKILKAKYKIANWTEAKNKFPVLGEEMYILQTKTKKVDVKQKTSSVTFVATPPPQPVKETVSGRNLVLRKDDNKLASFPSIQLTVEPDKEEVDPNERIRAMQFEQKQEPPTIRRNDEELRNRKSNKQTHKKGKKKEEEQEIVPAIEKKESYITVAYKGKSEIIFTQSKISITPVNSHIAKDSVFEKYEEVFNALSEEVIKQVSNVELIPYHPAQTLNTTEEPYISEDDEFDVNITKLPSTTEFGEFQPKHDEQKPEEWRSILQSLHSLRQGSVTTEKLHLLYPLDTKAHIETQILECIPNTANKEFHHHKVKKTHRSERSACIEKSKKGRKSLPSNNRKNSIVPRIPIKNSIVPTLMTVSLTGFKGSHQNERMFQKSSKHAQVHIPGNTITPHNSHSVKKFTIKGSIPKGTVSDFVMESLQTPEVLIPVKSSQEKVSKSSGYFVMKTQTLPARKMMSELKTEMKTETSPEVEFEKEKSMTEDVTEVEFEKEKSMTEDVTEDKYHEDEYVVAKETEESICSSNKDDFKNFTSTKKRVGIHSVSMLGDEKRIRAAAAMKRPTTVKSWLKNEISSPSLQQSLIHKLLILNKAYNSHDNPKVLSPEYLARILSKDVIFIQEHLNAILTAIANNSLNALASVLNGVYNGNNNLPGQALSRSKSHMSVVFANPEGRYVRIGKQHYWKVDDKFYPLVYGSSSGRSLTYLKGTQISVTERYRYLRIGQSAQHAFIQDFDELKERLSDHVLKIKLVDSGVREDMTKDAYTSYSNNHTVNYPSFNSYPESVTDNNDRDEEITTVASFDGKVSHTNEEGGEDKSFIHSTYGRRKGDKSNKNYNVGNIDFTKPGLSRSFSGATDFHRSLHKDKDSLHTESLHPDPVKVQVNGENTTSIVMGKTKIKDIEINNLHTSKQSRLQSETVQSRDLTKSDRKKNQASYSTRLHKEKDNDYEAKIEFQLLDENDLLKLKEFRTAEYVQSAIAQQKEKLIYSNLKTILTHCHSQNSSKDWTQVVSVNIPVKSPPPPTEEEQGVSKQLEFKIVLAPKENKSAPQARSESIAVYRHLKKIDSRPHHTTRTEHQQKSYTDTSKKFLNKAKYDTPPGSPVHDFSTQDRHLYASQSNFNEVTDAGQCLKTTRRKLAVKLRNQGNQPDFTLRRCDDDTGNLKTKVSKPNAARKTSDSSRFIKCERSRRWQQNYQNRISFLPDLYQAARNSHQGGELNHGRPSHFPNAVSHRQAAKIRLLPGRTVPTDHTLRQKLVRAFRRIEDESPKKEERKTKITFQDDDLVFDLY